MSATKTNCDVYRIAHDHYEQMANTLQESLPDLIEAGMKTDAVKKLIAFYRAQAQSEWTLYLKCKGPR